MTVECDNIFPATQYHLHADHVLSEEEQRKIIEALKIPMAGFVAATVPSDLSHVSAIEFRGSRIILTTQHNIGVDDTEHYRDVFMKAIAEALE